MSDVQSRPTVEGVLSSIRAELEDPEPMTPPPTRAIERLREQQRFFREEPVGGRLLPMKRLAYWFTASAFDRQAKVIESMIEVLDDLDARSVQPVPTTTEVASRGHLPDPRRDIEAGGEHDRRPQRLLDSLEVDAEMEIPEKLLLYSLAFGAKPERVLEIGTFRGGSTSVLCDALDDSGFGRIVCVDPEPRVPPDVLERIRHRATIVSGPSPEALQEAHQIAGDLFDFALIDGDHGYEGVLRDIEGSLPLLRPGALVLFHDSHYWEVSEAIDAALERFPAQLVDCGELSAMRNPQAEPGLNDRPVVWGGLRLLRRLRAS
jgi:hypothetical protein